MAGPSAAPRPDLDAYLARIDCSGPLACDEQVLRRLHLAHATRIPFENLDVVLGTPVRLDLRSVEAKLVHARRGGYCFEQNRLFAEVLRAIGFPVQELAARVRYRNSGTTPRTHMLLAVDDGRRRWLADVGFGAHGLLEPLPLEPGRVAEQYRWRYRIVADGDALVLQLEEAGTWSDLYAFGMQPQLPVDWEVANHYTATHPDSRFVHTLTAQLPGPQLRLRLHGRELLEDRGDGSQRLHGLDDAAALARALEQRFGVRPPAGFEDWARRRCFAS